MGDRRYRREDAQPNLERYDRIPRADVPPPVVSSSRRPGPPAFRRSGESYRGQASRQEDAHGGHNERSGRYRKTWGVQDREGEYGGRRHSSTHGAGPPSYSRGVRGEQGSLASFDSRREIYSGSIGERNQERRQSREGAEPPLRIVGVESSWRGKVKEETPEMEIRQPTAYSANLGDTTEPNVTLVVTGFPARTDDSVLVNVFSRFGDVRKVIRRNSNVPTALVRYAFVEQASQAMFSCPRDVFSPFSLISISFAARDEDGMVAPHEKKVSGTVQRSNRRKKQGANVAVGPIERSLTPPDAFSHDDLSALFSDEGETLPGTDPLFRGLSQDENSARAKRPRVEEDATDVPDQGAFLARHPLPAQAIGSTPVAKKSRNAFIIQTSSSYLSQNKFVTSQWVEGDHLFVRYILEESGKETSEMEEPALPEPSNPIPAFPLPYSPSSYDYKATKRHADTFIHLFLDLFESDRASLALYYSDDATFSVQALSYPPPGQCEGDVASFDTQVQNMTAKIYIGRSAIVRALQLLPALTHDRGALVYDAFRITIPDRPGASRSAPTLLFQLSGTLVEFESRLTRVFSRVMTVIPLREEHPKYRVISDALVLRPFSADQAKRKNLPRDGVMGVAATMAWPGDDETGGHSGGGNISSVSGRGGAVVTSNITGQSAPSSSSLSLALLDNNPELREFIQKTVDERLTQQQRLASATPPSSSEAGVISRPRSTLMRTGLERTSMSSPNNSGSLGVDTLVHIKSTDSFPHGSSLRGNKLRYFVRTSATRLLAMSNGGNIVEWDYHAGTSGIFRPYSAKDGDHVDEYCYIEDKQLLAVGYLGSGKDDKESTRAKPKNQLAVFRLFPAERRKPSVLERVPILNEPHANGGMTSLCHIPLSSGRIVLASAGEDKTVAIWRLSPSMDHFGFQNHADVTMLPHVNTSRLNSLAWSTAANVLVLGSEDKRMIVYNVDTGSIVSTVTFPGPIRNVEIVPPHPSTILGRLGTAEKQFVLSDLRLKNYRPVLDFGFQLKPKKANIFDANNRTLGKYFKGSFYNTLYAHPDGESGIHFWDLRNLRTPLHQAVPGAGRTRVYNTFFCDNAQLAVLEHSNFTLCHTEPLSP